MTDTKKRKRLTDGSAPTVTEAAGAVIWYAEHDAYEPIDYGME